MSPVTVSLLSGEELSLAVPVGQIKDLRAALEAARPLASELSRYTLSADGKVCNDDEDLEVDCYMATVSAIRLEQVHVRGGDLIDQLEFQYSDGTKNTLGQHGGGAREPFVLEAGEVIVAMKY